MYIFLYLRTVCTYVCVSVCMYTYINVCTQVSPIWSHPIHTYEVYVYLCYYSFACCVSASLSLPASMTRHKPYLHVHCPYSFPLQGFISDAANWNSTIRSTFLCMKSYAHHWQCVAMSEMRSHQCLHLCSSS